VSPEEWESVARKFCMDNGIDPSVTEKAIKVFRYKAKKKQIVVVENPEQMLARPSEEETTNVVDTTLLNEDVKENANITSASVVTSPLHNEECRHTVIDINLEVDEDIIGLSLQKDETTEPFSRNQALIEEISTSDMVQVPETFKPLNQVYMASFPTVADNNDFPVPNYTDKLLEDEKPMDPADDKTAKPADAINKKISVEFVPPPPQPPPPPGVQLGSTASGKASIFCPTISDIKNGKERLKKAVPNEKFLPEKCLHDHFKEEIENHQRKKDAIEYQLSMQPQPENIMCHSINGDLISLNA